MRIGFSSYLVFSSLHTAGGFSVNETAGGVYNTSTTPASLLWNTYNYCNAPHVKAEHYFRPTADETAKLVYLNVVTRHHKRTPDNLFPNENELNVASGWDCSALLQQSYGGGTAPVFHETFIPSWHPYISTIWNGTCDAGQLTREGLYDAIRHGQDFWSVYNGRLDFLSTVNPRDIHVRTTMEVRTHQVAGALLFGMDPATANRPWPVYTQPQSIDSLVPSYPCPAADALRNAYQSVPAWTNHLTQNGDLKARLDATLGTAGLTAWASWYDHYFDAFSSRTCNGHSLPCNATGACVEQKDAQRVYALGDWEYNYIWNAAENATRYNQLTFGVMFYELAQNLKSFQSGSDPYKLRFYVGHDGSMIRLASVVGSTGLGFGRNGPLRWPAMGSEIILEVWRTETTMDFVRVMHEGTPVSQLEWIALSDFIELLEQQIPDNIYKTCMGTP